MRTLIVSDLHLGSVSRADLLRRPELRQPLLEVAAAADRVVLLGDVLELRHGPPREALAVAKPVFEDLGRVLAGKQLVLVAGNHDHAMIEPWLARRAELPESPALGLEQLLDPAEASPLVEQLAEWAAPAQLRFAYPGLWVRPDVYAMHGHYLDCHLTVPTIERLSVGLMARLLGRPERSLATVGDYEAITAPMYAWRHAVARDARTSNALNGIGTVNAWRALRGDSNGAAASHGQANGKRPSARSHPQARLDASARLRLRIDSLAAQLRMRALVSGFPLAITALNRAGLGPLKAEISTAELRRAGLRAMGEVAARVGLGDAHVIFGHTHRAGPLAGDDEREWSRPPARPQGAGAGARLLNVGCWTYDSIFLTETPGESPYWPGSCAIVEDSGPPVLQRLLLDRTHVQLTGRGSRVTQAQA